MALVLHNLEAALLVHCLPMVFGIKKPTEGFRSRQAWTSAFVLYPKRPRWHFGTGACYCHMVSMVNKGMSLNSCPQIFRFPTFKWTVFFKGFWGSLIWGRLVVMMRGPKIRNGPLVQCCCLNFAQVTRTGPEKSASLAAWWRRQRLARIFVASSAVEVVCWDLGRVNCVT